MVTLDRAFTIDEKLWIERSASFERAVERGDFAATLRTGHPGVTTMWVAGLAQRTLPDDAGLRARYARARLWLAVVDVALILLAWRLARALMSPSAALLGAFFLALDPFLLAHNRVVHLDGLLSLLMLCSFLALVRGARDDDSRALVLSGGLAGLAFLTKQPAIFLVPAAIIALAIKRRRIPAFVVWVVPVGLVFVALWPAMWVVPGAAMRAMQGGGSQAFGEMASDGFFLGNRVHNPGIAFYPVAFAWRSSIPVLVGAIATAVWSVRRARADRNAATALALLGFALGFMAMMTVGAQKGDRYILPVFAVADVLVAIGLARMTANVQPRRTALAAAAVLALHGAPAIALHPYELAHFNWALGGPFSARHIMVVGWGEGLDESAGKLVRAVPAARDDTVAATRLTQFEDFFPGRTVGMRTPDDATFFLFYISSVQAGTYDEVWRRYERRRPFLQVTINHLPYVRIYQR
jgi:4-amino-4-deoxy-L-arabinose transferase-like glycosyltransferase